MMVAGHHIAYVLHESSASWTDFDDGISAQSASRRKLRRDMASEPVGHQPIPK